MTTQPFSFNTGRYYGPEGQQIDVTSIQPVPEHKKLLPGCDEYDVIFHDTTRKICGKINVIGMVTQRSVMAEYDEGRYECLPLSAAQGGAQ